MRLAVGREFGSYTIVKEIGYGSVGVVYKAYQPQWQRYVALKLIGSPSPLASGFISRLDTEARASTKLRHSNIVRVYDVGEQNGSHYIAMEYLEGQSLEAILDQHKKLGLARSAHIISQIASALDYAHALGYIHRDVKPSNIMIGANDHATLTDFGMVQAERTRNAKDGAIRGTPNYMAPEQILEQATDRRVDVYALGSVAYEMLAGRVPFEGDTVRVLYAQAHEPPPPLRQFNPRVPPSVEQVIGRALAKDSARRYASAGEFAHDYSAAVGSAGTPVPTPMPPKPLALLPLVGGAGGTFIVLMVIFAFVVNLDRPPVVAITSTSTPTRAATPTLTASATATKTSTPQMRTVTPISTYTPAPTSTPTSYLASPQVFQGLSNTEMIDGDYKCGRIPVLGGTDTCKERKPG